MELTPNVGYSFAMVFGEEDPGREPVFGVQYGLLGDFYLNDRWSIRSGVSHFTLGSSTPYTTLKLNYLNIPANANWHFGSEKHWNLNFGVTPQFLLKATDDDRDVMAFYKNFQLAFSYGMGYKIEVSEGFGILIDLQGLVGITNNLEDEIEIKRRNLGASLNIGGVIAL
ncbi:PorT family protein [Ulvibacter litoralis]|nr:PorT family protein [Ulvibacter litoralis]